MDTLSAAIYLAEVEGLLRPNGRFLSVFSSIIHKCPATVKREKRLKWTRVSGAFGAAYWLDWRHFTEFINLFRFSNDLINDDDENIVFDIDWRSQTKSSISGIRMFEKRITIRGRNAAEELCRRNTVALME
ncbi:hypothetical protein CEXT_815041 [Caerostris extrusa]|uniref:Uncharacterized protein n=1 Tax=Caerostris extrusa TaxID=172846 RepID=A0AAV4R493_CAEEX|nr:hypothetical protein CEXT_815041 [Caerostris extrusa]